MHLDLDKILEPWEFKITLGGREYSMRPLQLDDIAMLQAVKQDDVQGLICTMSQLFDGTPPEFSRDPGVAAAIYKAYTDYVRTRNEKNAGAVVMEVRKVATAGSITG